MKARILGIALFIGFVALLFNVYAAEKAIPVFDDRPWKLGWSGNKGDMVFEEYVLDGETVENWSELVTIQFFPGLDEQTNPDIFEGSQKRDLSLVCPSIQWESLYQSGNERIWKWSIKGCQGQPDQSEIARLLKSDEGFHIWHYAIKKSPMPPEQEKVWLEKLKAIVVIRRE